MKKILLLAAALLVGTLSGRCISYQFGVFDSQKKTCSITGWSGSALSSRLTLPEQYTNATGTYTVTAIEAHALDNLADVNEIVIPKGVARIGSVTALNLDSVANFNGCTELHLFTVAAGNTTFSATGAGVLVSAAGRNLVKVPQKVATESGVFKMSTSVTGLCRDAFAGNTSITELRLSPAINSFEGNSGLNDMLNLEYIDVNSTQAPIYYSLQYGVLFDTNGTRIVSYPPKKKGETYTAPIAVTAVGDCAFANCSYLYAATCSNATSIGVRAFAGSGITQATISSKVRTLRDAAFKGCPRLGRIDLKRDIDIPIEFAAGCPQLTAVTIASGIFKVNDRAFAGCAKLSSYPFTAYTSFDGDNIFEGCGFDVVKYSKSKYSGEWGYMGECMLAGNKNLHEVDISDVEIPTLDDSFDWGLGMVWDCPSINTVKFPALTSIWYNPNNIQSVFTPDCPIEHVEIGAFYPGHSPIFIFNQGVHIPHIYVKTTHALTKSCPLNKLFTLRGNAVMNAKVYCEAYDMANPYPYESVDEFAIPYSDYYVPANTRKNYEAALKKGCTITEIYAMDCEQRNGKYAVKLVAVEPSLTFDDVKINGTSVGLPNASGWIESNVAYSAVQNVEVSYTVRGVKFTTLYPTRESTSGMDAIECEDAPTSDIIYDIQGRRVKNVQSRTGIYITAKGEKVITQ